MRRHGVDTTVRRHGLDATGKATAPRRRFAVAELVNRLYLTGLLAFFGSSSAASTTTQTSLGLLGAIVYYVVLSGFDPYIDPSDNLLAKVAAFQVILTFFFGTM